MEDINPPKNASYWKRRCKRVEAEKRIKNTELQAEVNKWKHNSQYFADELAERLSKITELQAEIQELEDSLKFKDGEYQEMRELSYKFEQAFAVTKAQLEETTEINEERIARQDREIAELEKYKEPYTKRVNESIQNTAKRCAEIVGQHFRYGDDFGNIESAIRKEFNLTSKT